MVDIALTEQQSLELQQIADIGSSKIQDIARDLDSIDQPKSDPWALNSFFKTHIEPSKAAVLERQLLALTAFRRERRLGAEDVVGDLTSAIDGSAQWDNDQRDNWRKIKPGFSRLLSNETVVVSAKAMYLAFDHSKMLQGAWVVTDIRPIFNDKRDDISGALVTNTLRIDYYAGAIKNTTSLALDVSDLENLKNACDQAIKKAEAAKKWLKTESKIDAVIVGEKHAIES